MNKRDEVILEYGNRGEGFRRSGLMCPECNGGRSHERSFAAWITGGILRWQCHRASCPFNGWHSLTGSLTRNVAEPQKGELGKQVQVEPLSPELRAYLCTLYSIDDETIDLAGWKYCLNFDGHGPRVLMPILDPDGLKRGETFRAYNGALPKAIINKLRDEEQMCWYRFKKYAKTLIIVEDQPSALRAAEAGLHALALCGTLLTTDRLLEIKKLNYDSVYLCLDNDATVNAVRYAKVFRARLPQLRVKALDVDVKNMAAQQFELFVQEVSLP